MGNKICRVEVALYLRPYEFSNHQLGITCHYSFPWDGRGGGGGRGGVSHERAGNGEIEHGVYFSRKLNESFTKIGRNFAD